MGCEIVIEFFFALCEERNCSWVGSAPHRTDSIIRLTRGIDPVNVSEADWRDTEHCGEAPQ